MPTRKKKQLRVPSHKPKPKQDKVIEYMLANPMGGIFGDPGFGKTYCSLATCEILKEEKVCKKFLILAGVRVMHLVWPKEIEKFGFDLSYTVVHGPKRAELIKENTDVHLLNYENVEWFTRQPKKIREQYDVLIVDESSKFKNHATKRFKAIKKVLDNFDRRYILTGTPAPNGYMDLFSQMYLLDQGEALGQFITHYRNKYFASYGKKEYRQYRLEDGADKKIQKAVKHLIMRVPFDSKVELQNNFIEVELPKKIMKQYMQMESQLATEVNKEIIMATNAGVATGKLRQIANGHIFDNTKTSHLLHSEKIDALKDLISELQGQPLLVGYEFKPDLAMLKKAFPHIVIGGKKIKTEFVGGGTTTKESKRIEKQWNLGQLPLLFGQISTVAHGLNLQQCANHLCFYGMTWNLEDYIQFIKRLQRRGQLSKYVIAHHIMARGTVDYDMAKTIERKAFTQQDLLDSFIQRRMAA